MRYMGIDVTGVSQGANGEWTIVGVDGFGLFTATGDTYPTYEAATEALNAITEEETA